MKILAIGDLVSHGAVEKLKSDLPSLQKAENIDFTIVNAENVAEGRGITKKIFNELNQLNIDVYTMGNHTWGRKDIFELIDIPKLIVPANYSKGCPGHGYVVIEKNNKKICTINLIGRTNINDVMSNNPFEIADQIVTEVKADIYMVDFHAEATAEKLAMGHFLDGRITGLFGTHTHIPTADNRILPKGTGYITDLGMTGPSNSILGMDIKTALIRFVKSLPEKYKVAEGSVELNGAIFDIDDETNRVKRVYRVHL